MPHSIVAVAARGQEHPVPRCLPGLPPAKVIIPGLEVGSLQYAGGIVLALELPVHGVALREVPGPVRTPCYPGYGFPGTSMLIGDWDLPAREGLSILLLNVKMWLDWH